MSICPSDVGSISTSGASSSGRLDVAIAKKAIPFSATIRPPMIAMSCVFSGKLPESTTSKNPASRVANEMSVRILGLTPLSTRRAGKRKKPCHLRQGFCVFTVPYHAVALPVGAIGPGVPGRFQGELHPHSCSEQSWVTLLSLSSKSPRKSGGKQNYSWLNC